MLICREPFLKRHLALQFEERFPETSKPRFLPGAYKILQVFVHVTATYSAKSACLKLSLAIVGDSKLRICGPSLDNRVRATSQKASSILELSKTRPATE